MAEKSLQYHLPDNFVMKLIFEDGFQCTQKHLNSLQLVLYTPIAKHHIQWAKKAS